MLNRKHANCCRAVLVHAWSPCPYGFLKVDACKVCIRTQILLVPDSDRLSVWRPVNVDVLPLGRHIHDALAASDIPTEM